MTRYKKLGFISWIMSGTLAVSSAVSIAVAQNAMPNIIIFYVDDMGYGDFGRNNPNSKIPTPHLDRLADRGMNFTDGHASSGICTPSRYALLTGRHHWRDFHGIVNTFQDTVFKPGQLTLAKMLQEKGYTTAHIGKWHLGWDWDAIRHPGTEENSIHYSDFDWSKRVPGGPLDRGFDHYFGDDVINFPPYAWIMDDRIVAPPDSMMDVAEWKPIKEGRWESRPGPMVTGWDPYQNLPVTTRHGVDYIRKHADADKPFFLYFSYPSPHAPIIPNDEFDGKSQAGPYGDFIVETDHSMGQMLAALEESGLAENTIVIFSSDNGAEDYAFARYEAYGHWSSEPLRGRKRDIYEGGHRVPFVISWPGVVEPGRSSDTLISHIDLMATLASVVGYELPRDAAEDSFDFLPYLSGEVESGPCTSMVHNTFADHYAVRDGDWLLINGEHGYGSTGRTRLESWYENRDMSFAIGGESQGVQLHYLKVDIGQRHNLAAQHPERVKEMQSLLERLREQGYTAPRLLQ
jgi:arylsulfatase A